MPVDSPTPAERLEHHLAAEFVQAYITKAIGSRKAVGIDPNQIFLAARFQGLKISSRSINQAIRELMR